MKLLIITQKVDQEDDVLGFFHNWILKISQNLAHVTVIALAVGKVDLPHNVTVHSLGKEKGAGKIMKAFRFFRLAITELPKHDGVFVHMAPEYVRALYPFNIFFRKPIIMWYAHIHVSKVASWAMQHVDAIFTPSKESFAMDSSKVISTGHGIDTDIFKPDMSIRKNNVKTILSLSRISKVKRVETLIEATKILVDTGERNFRVSIVGKPARPEDDEYLESLKAKIVKLGIVDYVIWEGSVSNKHTPALYNKADVFVRLQGGGGYGKTELEAMACGVPIVVPTEVYKKSLGVYGESTFFTEDNAEMLAEKIKKIVSWSEQERNDFAHLARVFVEKNHNLNHVAEKIASTMKSLTSKK